MKALAVSMAKIGHTVYSPFVEMKLKLTERILTPLTSTNIFVTSHSATIQFNKTGDK